MKKIFVSIAVLVCTMTMLAIAASAVEINLVAPFEEEIQIAPGRDFYVVGTIDRNGMTPASLPVNVQIDLLDSKGNTVRTLKSNISPDGLTSAQFFMTDYERGTAVNDDKGASLIKFTPPDIVFDGTDRDTIRLAHNKILVRENYFAAIIFGGASKGFDLLYTSADETPLSDITAGEYALIITTTDINGEVVATCRRVLNFGTDKERIVSFDNALIKDYAKKHNITVSNSIVGNWVPCDYIGKARGFSYTIQARFAENVSKEYSASEKVNILLYNLNPKDSKTNLKLGSSYASKAEKALLYYDIGEPDVKFNFNGTELSRKGEIVKQDENRFVEILRSETTNEEDIYADFNAKDGFVLTKG
ncbi:MAG: hypothetical protein IJZ20_01695, partial [Clostridia bacterium]|nr:hypothetical protein [Clostridia bacterium]